VTYGLTLSFKGYNLTRNL